MWKKKEKAQRPGSTHSNKGGLPKMNFCPAQAVEGDRQESIRSPPGATYPISFSKSSTTHDFIRLPSSQAYCSVQPRDKGRTTQWFQSIALGI